jgi:hypothetical protein
VEQRIPQNIGAANNDGSQSLSEITRETDFDERNIKLETRSKIIDADNLYDSEERQSHGATVASENDCKSHTKAFHINKHINYVKIIIGYKNWYRNTS